jgi:hypothetical protein
MTESTSLPSLLEKLSVTISEGQRSMQQIPSVITTVVLNLKEINPPSATKVEKHNYIDNITLIPMPL